MVYVVLGLGSNREYNGLSCISVLTGACSKLKEFLKDFRVSSVYRSGALYLENQDDFYNMVVCGAYDGTPQDLLSQIHAVENEFGRDRSREVRNGPRSLDIDIELFGMYKIHTQDLIVPHERILERAFVLAPLVELIDKNFGCKDIPFLSTADILSEQADITYDMLKVKLESVKDQKIEKWLDAAELYEKI